MENKMNLFKDDEATIQAVWNKGVSITGCDSARFRQDKCTAWMDRNEYGNRKSILGWEIHHNDPNGPNEESNYLPLQWENNVATSDGSLKCAVHSNGNRNERS